MFGIGQEIYVYVFLRSVGVGFLIALVYGLFMLLRRLGMRSTAAVIAQDCLFFILAGGISYAAIFEMNAGIPRGYIFLGESIGFSIFFLYKRIKK